MASVIQTVPEVEEIREMCLRLLRHFNYRGFSAVEVKRDERDGKFKLIEKLCGRESEGTRGHLAPQSFFFHQIFSGGDVSRVWQQDTY